MKGRERGERSTSTSQPVIWPDTVWPDSKMCKNDIMLLQVSGGLVQICKVDEGTVYVYEVCVIGYIDFSYAEFTGRS